MCGHKQGRIREQEQRWRTLVYTTFPHTHAETCIMSSPLYGSGTVLLCFIYPPESHGVCFSFLFLQTCPVYLFLFPPEGASAALVFFFIFTLKSHMRKLCSSTHSLNDNRLRASPPPFLSPPVKRKQSLLRMAVVYSPPSPFRLLSSYGGAGHTRGSISVFRVSFFLLVLWAALREGVD